MFQPSKPSLDPGHRCNLHQSHPIPIPNEVMQQQQLPISHINRPLPEDKVTIATSFINAIDNIGLNLEQMAMDQPLDPDFQRLSTDSLSGLAFRKLSLGDKDLFVDVSNGPARPFVPFSWRRRVFDSLHALGHPGIEQTRKIIASKFVWPSMTADVTRWARECLHCQRSKVQRHVTPPIGDFDMPSRRFSHIHADLVSMPVSNGFNHLLTIVDRFTRWPVAVPLSNISAEAVLDALAQQWIAFFGVPAAITTDRGSQFTSAIWTQLLSTWGIKHHPTTAYHPQANGMVERLHKRLKESLMAACDDRPEEWFWRLPCTLLALRTTLKPDVGASPADLVFGEGLALPGELLPSHADATTSRERRQTLARLRLEVARLQPPPPSAHRTPNVWVPETLAAASHVFVRRGGVQATLTAPYEGPYKVASRGPHNYRIHFPGRGIDTVAIERLKPAFVSRDGSGSDQDLDEEAPPSPPPPGRRPGPRTRVPAPTTRRTRQHPPVQPSSGAPPSAPSAPPSTGARTRVVREPRVVLRRLDEDRPLLPPPSSEQQSSQPRGGPPPPSNQSPGEDEDDVHHSFFNFAGEMHDKEFSSRPSPFSTDAPPAKTFEVARNRPSPSSTPTMITDPGIPCEGLSGEPSGAREPPEVPDLQPSPGTSARSVENSREALFEGPSTPQAAPQRPLRPAIKKFSHTKKGQGFSYTRRVSFVDVPSRPQRSGFPLVPTSEKGENSPVPTFQISNAANRDISGLDLEVSRSALRPGGRPWHLRLDPRVISGVISAHLGEDFGRKSE